LAGLPEFDEFAQDFDFTAYRCGIGFWHGVIVATARTCQFVGKVRLKPPP
jgi:hypothetical protein